MYFIATCWLFASLSLDRDDKFQVAEYTVPNAPDESFFKSVSSWKSIHFICLGLATSSESTCFVLFIKLSNADLVSLSNSQYDSVAGS